MFENDASLNLCIFGKSSGFSPASLKDIFLSERNIFILKNRHPEIIFCFDLNLLGLYFFYNLKKFLCRQNKFSFFIRRRINRSAVGYFQICGINFYALLIN